MKRIKLIIGAMALGGALLLSSGCRKYLDVNTNPNVAQDVPVELLLPSAQIYLGSAVGVDLEIYGSYWSQYWTQSPASSQYKEIDRYSPTSSDYDRSWALIYSSALSDLHKMEKKAEAGNQLQYIGIAKILKAYAFQLATDGWGDVPFSEALRGLPEDGEITAPHYDPQASIYDGIIALVREGRTAIETSEANGLELSGDLIYGGDLHKWQQFANTLELRMFLRLSEKDPGKSQAGVTNIMATANAGAGFIDESSEAQIDYSSTAGNQNPLYAEMVGLNRTQNIVGSATVIDSMNANNDFRVFGFFNPINTGAFVGIAQGNFTIPSSTQVSTANTKVGALASDDNSALAPVKFISSYESYFLQAEAAARGWGAGNAKALFENGIAASFASYIGDIGDEGLILVDTPDGIGGVPLTEPIALDLNSALDVYMNGITTDSGQDYPAGYWAQFPTAGTVQQKVRHIITQKWFAMTGNQGFEAWNEWRRTGYPEFFTVSVESAIGKTKSILPRRFFYPDVEIQRNLSFPGQKAITDRVYWDIH
jgi:hypothetical protein